MNETGKRLMEIYYRMYRHFGPRGWWPAETPFEVIIGAVLTQFVSWRNVERAIANLKDSNMLSIDAICDVDTAVLEEHIRSTRFYKQKAKKLKVFCNHLKKNYGGRLEDFFKKPVEELRSELLSLYGIGEETADSIILYAAQKPVFVVDSYTRRIFSRLGFFSEDIKYGDMQNFFMDNLTHETALFNEYHALIDAAGNRYCSARKPDCPGCPLFGANCVVKPT